MDRIVLPLFLLFFGLSPSLPAMDRPSAEALARDVMELSEEEVRRKLKNFDASLLDHRMDDAVYRRIVNYIEHWPISSGRMIARSARFYPIFEEEIRAAGLPTELKHLSIVESALRSWAVSPVGAGGLWQLMPPTARELGLVVNAELDERLDPTLGCAAGLEYLKRQYERYGDWAVALAAYNSGPGNVNRAIRRSGSRNYWRMRRFLPRETRDYVPNFIAAVFLMSYHHHYGLPATRISLDDQLTERLLVQRRISLYQVARVTGLRPEVVIELNPQYTKGYLPGLRGGHYLQLPVRVIPAMEEYLATYGEDVLEEYTELPWADPLLAQGETNADRYYVRQSIVVEQGDSTARRVAQRVGLPVDRLLVWSEFGELDRVTAGDSLYHYEVAHHRPYDISPRNTLPAAMPIAATRIEPLTTSLMVYLHDLPQIKIVDTGRNRQGWWDVLR